ncbi:ketopantoate reductase family protein [Halalkalibacterium halodurans]|uniref:ketopantoate reductase family protein n=1 Tax=Halalkalibacterium halodurans TaxID=86665 RepID=UPI001068C701|nr:ketopantoate reductase family protein [Halalkalibacterium halodurans]MED3647695.1 ketopantoate reductase family protein [Halalkalibacterium halodurans]TES48708.1 ketopantoate reductase family protein [Halalkalibacterium halodurans]
MKFLIVGAGAVGGYFGARLAEKGEDVTFLVREKRKEQMKKRGLRIQSIHGNTTIQAKTITMEDTGLFDVVLLGTKAYHLENVIETIRPFIHDQTVIIPMLNGIAHLDRLRKAFSTEQVIGGLCFIESTLNEFGDIVQTSQIHRFVFGELNGERSERVKKIEAAFAGTNAMIEVSDSVLTEMWHKYMFITTMSGVTTLYNQPVGPIRELPSGEKVIRGLFAEIGAIMRAVGAPIADQVEEKQWKQMGGVEYEMKSSMQRDMEKGLPIEREHLQGYLLKLAELHQIQAPILATIYTNLLFYHPESS